MDTTLDNLEAEIAKIEREIGALQKTGKQNRKRRELQSRREWLIKQIQHATVGAAKPGQVL